MSRRAWLVLAAASALVLAAHRPARAQGLGDAASREKVKRERPPDPEAKPVRSFTDQDLEAEHAAAKAEAGPAEGGDQAAPGDAEPALRDPVERERHERELLRAEWRIRFANAREQLALAEANSWQEVVRTELRGGIPVPMKIREQVETNELRRARKALADLQEEFRRTGLPAGWARE